MEDMKVKEELTPKLRDVLSPPDGARTLLCAVLFLLSCFVLPTSDFADLCGMYILGCAVFYYMLTRSVRGLIVYAVPVFLLYTAAQMLPGLPTPLLLPACLLSLTVGGSCGGFLLAHAKGVRQLLPLAALPIVAWGAVFLVTGDPVRGLLVLLPTAVAIVCAFCLLHLIPRTSATLIVAATVAVACAVAALVTLAVTNALSVGSLDALADGLRGGIVNVLLEAEALYTEHGMSLGLSLTDMQNTAILFVNALPGLFLAVCGIAAFLVWRTLMQTLLAFRSLPRLPLIFSGMTVSRLCGLLFLVAALVAAIANTETATLLGTVCLNLALVLAAPLALVGFSSLLPGVGARSCLSTALGFALLFLLFYSFILAIGIAAAIGAVQVLIRRPRSSGEPPKNDNRQ